MIFYIIKIVLVASGAHAWISLWPIEGIASVADKRLRTLFFLSIHKYPDDFN
jgi:hypothetical protein